MSINLTTDYSPTGSFSPGPVRPRRPEPKHASQQAAPSEPAFSLREARTLLGSDLRPKAWVYWTDMLVSWATAMVAFKAVQFAELGFALRGVAFVVSCLLLYRCGMFIHEIVHLPEREFRGFRFAWNLLCGIPLLVPSFVYQTHLDHHRRKHYGTSHDGEYLPLSSRPVWHTLGYLAQSLVIPLLAIVRFGVLTPLTWLSPVTRNWVHRHASSMVIDPQYLRPLPSKKALRAIRLQELGCCLFIWVMAFGIVRSLYGQGIMNPWFFPQAYLTGVTVVTINALRTLGSHRWLNDAHANDDEPMTFVEQLLDSVNYPNRPWLTVLWAPIGTRFHALHHLFPTLPYHAMAEGHRRLMAGLPEDSLYRQTESPGLRHEIRQLLNRAAAA